MAVTSPVGGYLADRWGAQPMTLIGTLLIAAGLALAAPLPGSWHPLDLGWRLTLVGIGVGLFAGPNMAIALQQAPRHLLATAGATTSLARSLAFALGPAIATIPWALKAYSTTGMREAVVLSAGLAAVGAAAKGASVVQQRRAARARTETEPERRVA
jgi:MFS family permease